MRGVGPLGSDPAGPLGPGSVGFFFSASDGIALRGAHLGGGARGLVLLLQGRTETLEKYIPVAARLHARGWSVLALDWRGQGGSRRLTDDALLGHVDCFAAYQRDLEALLARPEAQQRPRVAIAHSMGGCIALRRLIEAPDTADCAIFSAPMWGLFSNRAAQWTAGAAARIACALGYDRTLAPGSGETPYALGLFEDNVLTSDPEQFAAMTHLAETRPELALAGLSWRWLLAAAREMRALAGRPLTVPGLVALGGDEGVVRPGAIRRRAARDGLELVEIDGARHEPLFETPPRRAVLWKAIDAALDRTQARA